MKKILFLISIVLSTLTKGYADPPIDTIDVMIGQMIMIGIGDFNVVDTNQPIFDEIKAGKVGGVVLYEKNIFLKTLSPNWLC